MRTPKRPWRRSALFSRVPHTRRLRRKRLEQAPSLQLASSSPADSRSAIRTAGTRRRLRLRPLHLHLRRSRGHAHALHARRTTPSSRRSTAVAASLAPCRTPSAIESHGDAERERRTTPVASSGIDSMTKRVDRFRLRFRLRSRRPSSSSLTPAVSARFSL